MSNVLKHDYLHLSVTQQLYCTPPAYCSTGLEMREVSYIFTATNELHTFLKILMVGSHVH